MKKSREELKEKFMTGAKPQQDDYHNAMDSFVHKDELAEVAESLRGPKGEDGKDAVNPFRGLYTSVSAIPAGITATAAEGDYLFAPMTSDGTKISFWRWSATANNGAGGWEDTGTEVDAGALAQLASGEYVAGLSLDRNLDSPTASGIAGAKAVVALVGTVEGEEHKLTVAEMVEDYYISKADGSPAPSSSGSKYAVIDVSGYNRVRFVGIKVSSSSTGYCFTDSGDNVLAYGGWDSADSTAFKIYTFEVPEGAKWFKTTCKLGGSAIEWEKSFFCYGILRGSVAKRLDEVEGKVTEEGTWTRVSLPSDKINGYLLSAAGSTNNGRDGVSYYFNKSASPNNKAQFVDVPVSGISKIKVIPSPNGNTRVAFFTEALPTSFSGYALAVELGMILGTVKNISAETTLEVPVDATNMFVLTKNTSETDVTPTLQKWTAGESLKDKLTSLESAQTEVAGKVAEMGELYDETEAEYTVTAGAYANGSTGQLTALEGSKYATVDVEGHDYVRFVGVAMKSSSYSTGFFFTDGADEETLVEKHLWDRDSTLEGNRLKQYLVPVPEGAKKLYLTVLTPALPTHEASFYCRLIKRITVEQALGSGDSDWKTVDTSNLTPITGRLYVANPGVLNETIKGVMVESDGFSYWFNDSTAANLHRRHIDVPIDGIAKIKVVANGTTTIAFFTKALNVTVSGASGTHLATNVGMIWGTAKSVSTELEVAVPEGATHMYVLTQDYISDAETNVTPTLYKKTKSAAVVAALESRVEALEEVYPDQELLPKLLALRKGSGGPSSTNGIKPDCFTFAHITDCHADNGTETSIEGQTWKRFINFCEKWKNYLDGAVNTGDNANTYGAFTGDTWMTSPDKVMFTVGNHDSNMIAGGTSYWRYRYFVDSGEGLYKRYIENNAEAWDVVQPDGAGQDGYFPMYYYKDYEHHKYNGIDSEVTTCLRAVFVDIMGWDDTEKQWLEEVLEGARANNMAVCIFTHYTPVKSRVIPCSYTSNALETQTANNSDTNGYHDAKQYTNSGGDTITITANDPKQMVAVVREFQEAGGVFACYIVGHRHIHGIAQIYGTVDIDGTTYNFDDERYPQLVVYGSCGYLHLASSNEFHRMKGTRNQDNFQVVAIDTYSGSRKVKVLKMGCEYNRDMQHSECVALTYSAYSEFDETVTTYTAGSVVSRFGCLWRFVHVVTYDDNGTTKTSWADSEKVPYSRVLSEAVRVL